MEDTTDLNLTANAKETTPKAPKPKPEKVKQKLSVVFRADLKDAQAFFIAVLQLQETMKGIAITSHALGEAGRYD